MDSQAMTLIRRMNLVSKTHFLLVQDDNILGVSRTPRNLPYSLLDQTQNWEIVAGTIQGSGKPEIVATVAKACPKPGKFCLRVSSPLDGDGRLVGNATSIVGIITGRLNILYGNGCYNKVNDLPPAIVAIGCDSGAPEKKSKKSA